METSEKCHQLWNLKRLMSQIQRYPEESTLLNENTLKGEAALALHQQGKNAWNAWCEQHPDWDIDFSEMTLTSDQLDFKEYQFPKNGSVSFRKTHFSMGFADFSHTVFGVGKKDFSNATFSEGKISFRQCQFGNGELLFYRTQFGHGDVDFYKAVMGSGFVDFRESKFGEGKKYFHAIQFGTDWVSFRDCEFGDGDCIFSWCRFDETTGVNFRIATFGKGTVDFRNIYYSKAFMSFKDADFSESEALLFSGSFGEGFLNFSGIKAKTVLDLTGSYVKRISDFDDAQIHYKKHPVWGFLGLSQNPKDSTAFRKLKKMAKEAEDYERVLDFFAKEKRSAYWHEIKGLRLLIYYGYDIFSNYGRSVFRPLIALLFFWQVFAFSYFSLSPHSQDCQLSLKESNNCHHYVDAMVLSASHSIPILPNAKSSQDDSLNQLFGEKKPKPSPLHFLTFGQNFLSGIFLFLTILGLRNRFKT